MKTKENSKLGEIYKKSGYNICPYCGSFNISGGHFESDCNYAWRNIECLKCEKEWTEEFTITAVLFEED